MIRFPRDDKNDFRTQRFQMVTIRRLISVSNNVIGDMNNRRLRGASPLQVFHSRLKRQALVHVTGAGPFGTPTSSKRTPVFRSETTTQSPLKYPRIQRNNNFDPRQSPMQFPLRLGIGFHRSLTIITAQRRPFGSQNRGESTHVSLSKVSRACLG